MQLFILFCNRISKLFGNITKVFISYPFHFIFPDRRFTIPEFSKAKIKGKNQVIPKIIWQTNYTNKVSLPVYLNYLFNRLMTLDYEYHYVSTENRHKFIIKNFSQNIAISYARLNDGAAQADLWRILTLQKYGGIYIDIDAHLVFPLSKIITKDKSELFIIKGDTSKWSNYFIATSPNHNVMEIASEIIINNIDNNKKVGVFSLTGPVPFSDAIIKSRLYVNDICYRYVCIQGSFTNEYFQYIDKQRGKWTYKKVEDILL